MALRPCCSSLRGLKSPFTFNNFATTWRARTSSRTTPFGAHSYHSDLRLCSKRFLSLSGPIHSFHRNIHCSRVSATSNASEPTKTRNSASTANSEPEKTLLEGAPSEPAPEPPRGNSSSPFSALSLPSFTRSSSFDAAVTTAIGLMIVFGAGVGYLSWYKARVLDKVQLAFARGYDPALALMDPEDRDPENDEHIRRREQDLIDSIISGRAIEQYYLVMGPKGTGKGSMLLDAMLAIQADGVAFCEAHEDLEVFRLRLGRALNFEYMEDSQTGLFQRRDPREGGPALDIERALNKLEKVALRLRPKRNGRPLVLCISNIHMFDDNEDSRRLLHQIQQRAESWAASGILTVVFTTDDYWPYPILRKNANRLKIISISDLSREDSLRAFQKMSGDCFNLSSPIPWDPATNSTSTTKSLGDLVVELTGGRMSLLGKLAKSSRDLPGVQRAMQDILEAEKSFVLGLIGLIPDLDDDVMDEQKWSSCSWLLLQEFVRIRQEDEAARNEQLANGATPEEIGELPVPTIPYWRCRQIMTRPDFLERLDHDNIISIDVNQNVTLDSALVLCAARQVVEAEGFQDTLNNVRDRVDEIESLHRTAEVTVRANYFSLSSWANIFSYSSKT
ncbi:hypothetical protein DL93DRAFT_2052955 [Clavulina sp. PMI_390]|nr:hypothetical protein DL93DRAFT_2052955 [Clavulina sp. PMI_390]